MTQMLLTKPKNKFAKVIEIIEQEKHIFKFRRGNLGEDNFSLRSVHLFHSVRNYIVPTTCGINILGIRIVANLEIDPFNVWLTDIRLAKAIAIRTTPGMIDINNFNKRPNLFLKFLNTLQLLLKNRDVTYHR